MGASYGAASAVPLDNLAAAEMLEAQGFGAPGGAAYDVGIVNTAAGRTGKVRGAPRGRLCLAGRRGFRFVRAQRPAY